MTPREIIALATHSHACDGEYSLVGGPAADAAIQALTGAGYSIIHDSENHGPTVERAAEVAETCPDTPFSESRRWHGNLHNSIPNAIRAMTTGGRDAD